MRRILSVLLENESGALSRVVGLFSQRAFNIESLTVAPTDDSTLSRMTIEAYGDEQVLEIEAELVSNITNLSIPIPNPPVGGIPYSNDSTKSSSIS